MSVLTKAMFVPVIAILLQLFVINSFGVKRGWYKKKGNWFSRGMHFSAGFFVAMFWSNFFEGWMVVVVLTFLIGVAWEIYEYLQEIVSKKLNMTEWVPERNDWVEDLVMDTLGAIVLVLALTLI